MTNIVHGSFSQDFLSILYTDPLAAYSLTSPKVLTYPIFWWLMGVSEVVGGRGPEGRALQGQGAGRRGQGPLPDPILHTHLPSPKLMNFHFCAPSAVARIDGVALNGPRASPRSRDLSGPVTWPGPGVTWSDTSGGRRHVDADLPRRRVRPSVTTRDGTPVSEWGWAEVKDGSLSTGGAGGARGWRVMTHVTRWESGVISHRAVSARVGGTRSTSR